MTVKRHEWSALSVAQARQLMRASPFCTARNWEWPSVCEPSLHLAGKRATGRPVESDLCVSVVRAEKCVHAGSRQVADRHPA